MHGSLICCVAQEYSEEKNGKKVEERTGTREETQVMAKEELEEIDLGIDPLKPKPISINSKLSEEEKLDLIRLLREFRNIFAWEYNEMLGLDPSLVVHTLNVELGTKPMAQPANVFHTDTEAQIIQEVQKLLTTGFIKPIQHPKWLSNIVPIKKKNG